jgi:hypothetical protein
MNKLKSIFAVAFAVIMLSFGAFAQLANDTYGTTNIQQLTFGPSPVWRVTNLDPVNVAVVRFAQPSGFAATITLPANGGYYNLGGFEPFYEWTCKNGGRPSVSPTSIVEPNYANHVAGTETFCIQ